MNERPNPGGVLRYLTFAGLTLLALMMSLEPDVGFTAPPAARLLFWTLQIVTGLFVLQSTLYLLTRRYGASRLPSWAWVVLSAVLGAVVLAPVYWLIGEGLMQSWLRYPVRPDADTDDLIGVTFSNPLVAEYFDIVGPVATAWTLICLPRLHWLVPPLLHGHARPPAAWSSGDDASPTPPDVLSDPPAISQPAECPPAGPTSCAEPVGNGKTAAIPAPPPPRPAWSERLPTALGTDVIAVASELQYLRVWTPRGCALILGALADVESEGTAHGLRVHRSWWVACAHVTSVRRTAAGAICLMSDGREVPVSRRRRAEVLARFGDGARYCAAVESEAVPHPDLH